jgi:hypothetical protein
MALVTLLLLHFRMGLLSPLAFSSLVAVFGIAFTVVSRRSARKRRERRLRELEQLRGQPVLHLND